MTKFRIATLLGTLLLLACAVTAMAGMQDFTFGNQGGLTIVNLYVSPSSSPDWGGDVLGSNVLGPGQSTDVWFDGSSDECYWDIMVVLENGVQDYISSVDLCSVSYVSYP